MRTPSVYRERLRELLRLADVVKASEEDLAYLDPDQTPHQTARGLLEQGPSLVLLTHGGRGRDGRHQGLRGSDRVARASR